MISPAMLWPPLIGADMGGQRTDRIEEEQSACVFVAVRPGTTQDDVLRAYKMVRSIQPQAAPEGRPTRDPLVAAQCAVWHDEYGWKVPEIAKRLGWKLSKDDYGKARRSKKVSDHVESGRAILRENNGLP